MLAKGVLRSVRLVETLSQEDSRLLIMFFDRSPRKLKRRMVYPSRNQLEVDQIWTNIMTDKEIAEVRVLAFSAAKDYIALKAIKSGLNKGQHSGMILHALVDAGLISCEDDGTVANDTKQKAFAIISELENGSQVRQQLEKAGVLGSAVAIAQEYTT